MRKRVSPDHTNRTIFKLHRRHLYTIERVLVYGIDSRSLEPYLLHNRTEWPQVHDPWVHHNQSRFVVGSSKRTFVHTQIVDPQEACQETRFGESALKDLGRFYVCHVQLEFTVEGFFAEDDRVAAIDYDLRILGRISVHGVRGQLELFSAVNTKSIDDVSAEESIADG